MPDQNIRDFINAAFNSKPIDATDAFNAGMHERLGPILQAKSAEVTQKLFQGDVETATEEAEGDEEDADPDPAGVDEGITGGRSIRNVITGASTSTRNASYNTSKGKVKVKTTTKKLPFGSGSVKTQRKEGPNGVTVTTTRKRGLGYLSNNFDPELQEKVSASDRKLIDNFKGKIKKLPAGKAEGSVERRNPGLASRDQTKNLTVNGRTLKRR